MGTRTSAQGPERHAPPSGGFLPALMCGGQSAMTQHTPCLASPILDKEPETQKEIQHSWEARAQCGGGGAPTAHRLEAACRGGQAEVSSPCFTLVQTFIPAQDVTAGVEPPFHTPEPSWEGSTARLGVQEPLPLRGLRCPTAHNKTGETDLTAGKWEGRAA